MRRPLARAGAIAALAAFALAPGPRTGGAPPLAAQPRPSSSAPAVEPRTDQARLGREVFERAACVLCHTVRGTSARGSVGPELTHLASRTSIAGGALRNTTANLEAWAVHAQSLKPGVRMPDLPQFTGVELRALTVYLQSLE